MLIRALENSHIITNSSILKKKTRRLGETHAYVKLHNKEMEELRCESQTPRLSTITHAISEDFVGHLCRAFSRGKGYRD